MKRLQAFKFKLRPRQDQTQTLRQVAGCCRLVWNRALALEKETYRTTGKRKGYYALAAMLKDWKREKGLEFLANVYAQVLQVPLKNLEQAYQNFYAKRASLPRFKKRGVHDSFMYHRGIKLDEGNCRIWLPKIGWLRYRKSRDVHGTIKQAIVSCSAGSWYISIQTEQNVPDPVHQSDSVIGIDMGVTRFATLSDGTVVTPENSFLKYERKLARLQRKQAKRVHGSFNWKKAQIKLQRLYQKIANVRKDFLHKTTTELSKNHAVIVMEKLKVKNMSASAAGTIENPGHNVRAKSGLNKAILDQGWYEFRRQLEYKLKWLGGKLILVAPQFTSLKCSRCGCLDKNNRKTQARFRCQACGFECNADDNAAANILAAGLAVTACGVGKAHAPMLKQEPTVI